MIDIWKIDAAKNGGCDECPHDEDRADDVAEFRLGTWRAKLCRAHRLQLEQALTRFREREAAEPGARTPVPMPIAGLGMSRSEGAQRARRKR